jgi:hypothetical protein
MTAQYGAPYSEGGAPALSPAATATRTNAIDRLTDPGTRSPATMKESLDRRTFLKTPAAGALPLGGSLLTPERAAAHPSDRGAGRHVVLGPKSLPDLRTSLVSGHGR